MGRCYDGNLLENSSFETGLTGWTVNNVTISGDRPFEGVATARMGQTTASMFQDVLLDRICRKTLFLSFEMLPLPWQEPNAVGKLVAEVFWIDDKENIIGTGLRTLIPEERTSCGDNRLTFVEITDMPPENAVKARLQFSKGTTEINTTNILDIDNVILAPIGSINLVKNSGFQLGLNNWSFSNASVQFTNIYEGTASINLEPNGTLTQNIVINNLPYNSNFLLSFAIDALRADDFPGETFLRAQVIWLNKLDSPIGTGLELLIYGDKIQYQRNYATYVDVTTRAPKGAVTAQVKFTNTDPNFGFNIDKVIFARVGSGNLIENSGFENASSISPWIVQGTTAVETTTWAYEGRRIARISNLGGSISRTVTMEKNYWYLLSFGYHNSNENTGNMLVEVYWLDSNDQEVGVGLSIIAPSIIRYGNGISIEGDWITYLGVTDLAPENAVKARIQFSRLSGNASINIDKVVFVRLV